MAPPSSSPASPPAVVGVDLGTLATKLTLDSAFDHELVRDAHGGHSLPTAITFAEGRARLLGEDAADVGRGDGNAVWGLDRLLPGSLEGGGDGGEDELAKFRRFEAIVSRSDPGGVAKVRVPSVGRELSGTALVAALLGRARRNVLATLDRLDGGGGGENEDGEERALHFAFAAPSSYPSSARAALLDAAYAASISSASVVNASECYAAVYNKKFGGEEASTKAVLVAEVGHARSSATVLKMSPDGSEAKGSEVEVLSSASHPTLGAFLADAALYDHFVATHPKLVRRSFETNSRPAQRLLEGCKKLKHLLSMLSESSVIVETVGENDADVTLSCTREKLAELCQAGLTDGLKALIASSVEKAGGMDVVGGIDAAELAGGGTRMPVVQDAVRDALGKGADFPLSRSFDDAALAFGASLVGVPEGEDVDAEDAERAERRAKLLADETAAHAWDDALRKKDEVRNKIEAHVLELRSARHSNHGALLPSTPEFDAFLDGTDDWLFSEECDAASLDDMEEKWNQVRSKTDELCGAYLAAKKKEAEEKDRIMEEEARIAAAERAAEGGDDEDHDTRKLPFGRRMEIVAKNKAEANELFGDGNVKHAAARYAKALGHCGKFFDLSPEQSKEVDAAKLSLNLNLALAYTKLEKWEQARRCCDDALKLDSDNAKALYRRAAVSYNLRKFDDATDDLKEAERLAPEDKAVKKLRKLVDVQVAKQKKKERAMAKKMFG